MDTTMTPTHPESELVALLELSAIADEMRSRKVGHAKRRSPTLVKWADRIDKAIEATRAATVPQGVSVDAEDSARLDWVVSNGAVLCGNGDAHWVWYPRTDEVQEGHYATPRAAIDAAMTPPPAEASKGDL